MKENIKDLWIKALRSGEFRQCKNRLEANGKYCALGVLAALALTESQCSWNKGGRYDGKRYSLSAGIMHWAGIAQSDDRYLTKSAGKVEFKIKGKVTTIADLNDSGMSFTQIAAIIEDHWMDL